MDNEALAARMGASFREQRYLEIENALRSGRADVALFAARTALEEAPDDWRYYILLARAFLALGRPLETLLILDAAQRRGIALPDDEELRGEALTERDQRGLSPDAPIEGPPPQAVQQVTDLANANRLEEAAALARKLTLAFPRHGFGWFALCQTLFLLRRFPEAAVQGRLADIFAPNDPLLLNLRGLIARETGRSDEAAVLFERAIALDPNLFDARFNLAALLAGLGKLGEAETHFRQALGLAPGHAAALAALAQVLSLGERFQEAESVFRQVLTSFPDHPGALLGLASLLQRQERLFEAEQVLRRTLTLHSGLAAGHFNLANVLRDQGREAEAEAAYLAAMRLAPNLPEPRINLAGLLTSSGRLEEAREQLGALLRVAPEFFPARNNLGNLLMDLGRHEEALAAYDQALAANPGYADAQAGRGNVLLALGRLAEAEDAYKRAVADDRGGASSNLLYFYAYAATLAPGRIKELARGFETRELSPDERRQARERRFANAPRAGRPLRVGFVSAELGRHSVAHFLEPVLRAFDPRRLEIFLYPTRERSGPVTERFRAAARRWRSLTRLDDAQAAAAIREDAVDVLVDVTGHTAGGRLGLFARRAAPVQCHYIGYPGTTGLTEMDYFLGDAVLTPPELDAQFRERVWRLPRLWQAYDSLDPAPEAAWSPSPDGGLVLCSFNNTIKVQGPCLDLWAAVLRELPEARLCVKDSSSVTGHARERIRAGLAARDVDPDRAEFLGRVANWREHMALYDQADLALDTVPYNGCTTSFEALWMGVPLVALTGDRVGARMGAAIVTALGHAEWVARNEKEYVEKVVALARDVAARRRLRPAQRERMRQSPLCDAADLARALEDAFEAMFDARRR